MALSCARLRHDLVRALGLGRPGAEQQGGAGGDENEQPRKRVPPARGADGEAGREGGRRRPRRTAGVQAQPAGGACRRTMLAITREAGAAHGISLREPSPASAVRRADATRAGLGWAGLGWAGLGWAGKKHAIPASAPTTSRAPAFAPAASTRGVGPTFGPAGPCNSVPSISLAEPPGRQGRREQDQPVTDIHISHNHLRQLRTPHHEGPSSR